MSIDEKLGLPMGKATRDAFGKALAELGKTRTDIVVVDGDVNNSTRTEWFAKAFPERFFNVGIAESNLVGVTAGLASAGHAALCSSFACFLMCNAYEQIRMSVAYPHLNVKLVGSHAGISIGEDGASQMGIEDVSLACSLPGFTVVVPADEPSTKEATKAIFDHIGPVYMRCGRPDVPIVYPDGCPFTLGKANQLRDGDDLTIIANGIMVAPAVRAAETLAEGGIQARVLDMHTVKPIDDAALSKAAVETGAFVVAEEHLAHGGLGSAVALAISQVHPVPIQYINLGDRFGESGEPQELLEAFGLTPDAIVGAAKRVIQHKGEPQS